MWLGSSLFSRTQFLSRFPLAYLAFLLVSFGDSFLFHNDWGYQGYLLSFYTPHFIPGEWDQFLSVVLIVIYAHSGMKSCKEPSFRKSWELRLEFWTFCQLDIWSGTIYITSQTCFYTYKIGGVTPTCYSYCEDSFIYQDFLSTCALAIDKPNIKILHPVAILL